MNTPTTTPAPHTSSAPRGEKRGVVDPTWTPRFGDIAEVEAFEQQIERFAAQLPKTSAAQETRP